MKQQTEKKQQTGIKPVKTNQCSNYDKCLHSPHSS
jgi:hypothetical protein